MHEQSQDSGDRFLSTGEAAAYLRVSKAYLYHLTSRGEIRHYKPSGKIIHFRKSDLDAFIMRFEVPGKIERETEAARRLGKRGAR